MEMLAQRWPQVPTLSQEEKVEPPLLCCLAAASPVEHAHLVCQNGRGVHAARSASLNNF